MKYNPGQRVTIDGAPTHATIDSTHISTHGTTYNATDDNGTSISDIPEHNIHPIHPAPTTHTHHATSLYKKDDRITYTNPRGRTHPGRIIQPLYITPTPTYDIALDNGDEITDVPEANITPETIHDLITPGTRIALTLRNGETHYGTIESHDPEFPSFYGIKWDDGTRSTDRADELEILLPDNDPQITTTTTPPNAPLHLTPGTRVTTTTYDGATSTGTITRIDTTDDPPRYVMNWDDGDTSYEYAESLTPTTSTPTQPNQPKEHHSDLHIGDRVTIPGPGHHRETHYTGTVTHIHEHTTDTYHYTIQWDDNSVTTREPRANLTKQPTPPRHPTHQQLPIGTTVQHTTNNATYIGTIIDHREILTAGSDTETRYQIQWNPPHKLISTERRQSLTLHTPTFTPLVFTPRQD